MAVVINEFEVVVESPPQQAETPFVPPPSPALKPRDIADVMRHQAERQARLWAH